jgi:hypothetical protein
MSTTIHVRNGTPAGNVSLCHTCRHAHIQQGYADSEEQVRCGYFYEQIRVVQFTVRTCTDYLSKLVKTVCEMEKVAFIPMRRRSANVAARALAKLGSAPAMQSQKTMSNSAI